MYIFVNHHLLQSEPISSLQVARAARARSFPNRSDCRIEAGSLQPVEAEKEYDAKGQSAKNQQIFLRGRQFIDAETEP